MGYPWLNEFLLSLPGASKDYKEEWEAHRYLLGDKMFAMLGEDKEGRAIITFKLEPLRGEQLRGQFPADLAPGYYMNKVHWNSLQLNGQVPNDVVRGMAQESHRLILAAMSKKQRLALLGESAK